MLMVSQWHHQQLSNDSLRLLEEKRSFVGLVWRCCPDAIRFSELIIVAARLWNKLLRWRYGSHSKHSKFQILTLHQECWAAAAVFALTVVHLHIKVSFHNKLRKNFLMMVHLMFCNVQKADSLVIPNCDEHCRFGWTRWRMLRSRDSVYVPTNDACLD